MAVAPAHGVYCSKCLVGGHQTQAIEYLDGDALCAFCRDGDVCPRCSKDVKVAPLPKVKRLAKDTLDDWDIDLTAALALYRSGRSTDKVARGMGVPPWRFHQSRQWRKLIAGTKRINEPAVSAPAEVTSQPETNQFQVPFEPVQGPPGDALSDALRAELIAVAKLLDDRRDALTQTLQAIHAVLALRLENSLTGSSIRQ